MSRVELRQEDIRAAIDDCARSSSDATLLRRLVALLMVSEGDSCQRVGGKFGESGRTVQRWASRFREKGVEGLRDRERGGRPPYLDDELWHQLKEDFSLRPSSFGYVRQTSRSDLRRVRRARDIWTVSRLAEHLQSRYGVMVSLRQYQRFFRRLMQECEHFRRL